MAKKMGKIGIFSAGIFATGPLLVACGGGPSYDEWAATDGAAGRINLDDVQEAFKKSDSATDFERRVNEIYEGDGLIYVRARQDGEALTLEGWEDLNGNSEIDDAEDDLLFSIVKENEQNNLRGHGSNGYYRSSFGGGNFLFTYLLLSSFSRGPYFYHSPNTGTYRRTVSTQRTSYRSSSSYTNQVSKNSRYNTRQKTFAGSRYQQAGQNQSTARRTYQSTQRTTGTFKSSKNVSRGVGGKARGGGAKGGSGVLVVLKKLERRTI